MDTGLREDRLEESAGLDIVREALQTLQRLLSVDIVIVEGNRTVTGDSAGLSCPDAVKAKVEVHDRSVTVYLCPKGDTQPAVPPSLVAEVVRYVLELGYNVEDMASGLAEYFDYQDEVLKAVGAVLPCTEIKEIVLLFLRQVTDLFEVSKSFAVVEDPATGVLKAWFADEGQPQAFSFHTPRLDKLKTIVANYRTAMSEMIHPAWRLLQWLPSDSDHKFLTEVLSVPEDHAIFALPLPVSEQQPFGLVGVSRGSGDLESVEHQWLSLYFSLMAGVVAGIFWAQQRREKAIARARAFQEAAARAAHRIKNPTFSILGQLDLLASELEKSVGALPGAVSKKLEAVRSLVRRIEQTAVDFQTFAQELAVVVAPIDLRTLLEDILSSAATTRGRARVGEFILSEDCRPQPYLVKELLVSVMEELIGNSLRVMPEGGEVRVECTGPHGAGSLPLIQMQCDYYLLTVSDDGPGVPAEDKERIFEPFFTKRPDGTGLGLAIVRKYCEMMGCVVREDGEFGKGARFRIGLPTLPPPETAEK